MSFPTKRSTSRGRAHPERVMRSTSARIAAYREHEPRSTLWSKVWPSMSCTAS